MLRFWQLFAVLCLASLAQCKPNTTESFAHNVVLDAGEVMTVYWNFNDTSITFEIHGRTEGWVGIGISPSGSMANADIMVGWVKNGVATITDRHGQSVNGYPPQDTVQNVELLEGMEVDGYTVIKFRRLLVTCDSEDIDITADTVKMIYAWGLTDPVGDDIAFGNVHEASNKGVKSIVLLNPAGSDEVMFPEGETHLTFDLVNDQFHVPAEDTYYNCHLIKLPDMADKHHLVKVEPIIQAGHELNVHHMLVYHCTDDANITLVNEDATCYSSNMPEDFHSCEFVIIAWAIGGGSFHFPKHAGYPLGTPDAPKYVVLETHYDNPEIKSDIVDSSGLRFYYTPDLRTHDSGIMEVGHVVSGFTDIIPPNAETFLDYGECTENCLGSHMKMEGQDSLNVFAVLLHSHLLGRELTLKHVRNGTELPYLAKDSSYDFNFQETRFLSEERVLNQGDSMQMICNYNSLDRSTVTLGGLSTSEEMCLSYVYYYPKMSLGFCESEADLFLLLQHFGIAMVSYVGEALVPGMKNLKIESPPEIANQTVWEYLNTLNWDEASADDFGVAAQLMFRSQKCYSTKYSPVEVERNWPPLIIDNPYVETAINCTQAPTNAPTDPPTDKPTDPPTDKPTDPPTDKPTDPPTDKPTDPQTDKPTDPPTDTPDDATTMNPTSMTPIQEEETTSAAAKLNFTYSFVIVLVAAFLQNINGV